MPEPLYLTITRGTEDRPIIATSDPAILRAVARALYAALAGPDRLPALRLARELDDGPAPSATPDDPGAA